MPITTHVFDAVLFDMDGTLIDSTAGVIGAWRLFEKTYPGIDVHDILSSEQLSRLRDTVPSSCCT